MDIILFMSKKVIELLSSLLQKSHILISLRLRNSLTQNVGLRDLDQQELTK